MAVAGLGLGPWRRPSGGGVNKMKPADGWPVGYGIGDGVERRRRRI